MISGGRVSILSGLLAQAGPSEALQVYLATLNTLQVLLLAWIGAGQVASNRERHRRREEDSGNK